MLKLSGAVCVNATPQHTWNILSDLERIHQWSETIETSTCVTPIKQGVGAIRRCVLNNKITIDEEIVYWSDGVSFSYLATGLPLVKKAKNTWSVKAFKNDTLITTESEIEMKYGVAGRLLEPILALMTKKMGRNTLAALKFLVENGYPYPDKHAKLPKFKAVC